MGRAPIQLSMHSLAKPYPIRRHVGQLDVERPQLSTFEVG
jgi:hypothetical protein